MAAGSRTPHVEIALHIARWGNTRHTQLTCIKCCADGPA
jgi:hypothetical protein